MDPKAKVIALVLDEPAHPERDLAAECTADHTGAHKLIRGSDGRVTLEPVVTHEDFDRAARDTGCFRRGRPIRDPVTFKVIGYEMEEVRAADSRGRR